MLPFVGSLPWVLSRGDSEPVSHLPNCWDANCPLCLAAGHETTFCAFLFCLAKLGVLQEQDCQVGLTSISLGPRFRATWRLHCVQGTAWVCRE